MKPVLLLIDLQNDYLDREPIGSRKAALLQKISTMLAAFRKRQLPIIHVISIYKADRSNWTLSMLKDDWPVVIEGTRGVEIPGLIAPHSNESVVVKDRFSAFFQTDLEKILALIKCDNLVCVGINTHACVRMTAIDAFMRDIRVTVLEDCVDSWDPEHHRVTLEYLSRGIATVTTSNEVLATLS